MPLSSPFLKNGILDMRKYSGILKPLDAFMILEDEQHPSPGK
jgi:hypothetical protein